MKIKIKKKQYNSKKCLICGLENEFSLRTRFYEMENGELFAKFKVLEEHQSYPGRLHGGIASAILDETIGRAIMITEPDSWGVTVELKIEYKKPLPLDQNLIAIGRITKNSKRIFEGTGEIHLENGDVAVIAHGKYMKLPLSKIADGLHTDELWIDTKEDIPEFAEY
ncbi:MAG: PaaI family thioesterase [Eubacteriales bacterium]